MTDGCETHMPEEYINKDVKLEDQTRICIGVGIKVVQLFGVVDTVPYPQVAGKYGLECVTVSFRRDIDPEAFRKAVVDLYTNFPSKS